MTSLPLALIFQMMICVVFLCGLWSLNVKLDSKKYSIRALSCTGPGGLVH